MATLDQRRPTIAYPKRRRQRIGTFLATLLAVGAIASIGGPLIPAASASSAQQRLDNSLNNGMQQVGGTSGAYVLDLNTGKVLYSSGASTYLLPASVEKLYTTSTALLLFGSKAKLTTSIYGRGYRSADGTWHGTLFIRGGGDPTFGSTGFDQYAYGTGATMGVLVENFLHATHTRALKGSIIGDESYFDSLRGTPATGYQFSPYLEGSLSAIAYNRGLTPDGSDYIMHPALYAAQQLAAALQGTGFRIPSQTGINAGYTPRRARLLATVSSPRLATLIHLTNTPSDNFFAEMLLKGIGARFGAGGNSAAGAGVVRAQVRKRFGIQPQLDDGSGLSRDDATTPHQVVRLLHMLQRNTSFVHSLAIAGETGTLQDEMQGTSAQGRCRGKTGTLYDVANLVGYCHSEDGHTLAFAFLMNGVSDPNYAHGVEANMAVSVQHYNG
jgi:D-alanyl-D-alanine carboxypeptidase/D-alanyl-D-alanine-endopeptidase (penicillin-binding protein 4)